MHIRQITPFIKAKKTGLGSLDCKTMKPGTKNYQIIPLLLSYGVHIKILRDRMGGGVASPFL